LEDKAVSQTRQQQDDTVLDGHGSQPQDETDDAYFAKQRNRQDPEAEGLDDIGDIDDLDDDTLGPDAARNLGGGTGDFRQSQDTGADTSQEW